MRLCDTDIVRYLDEGLIEITPRPTNDKISGATVDVRLGNSVFSENTLPLILMSVALVKQSRHN